MQAKHVLMKLKKTYSFQLPAVELANTACLIENKSVLL